MKKVYFRDQFVNVFQKNPGLTRYLLKTRISDWDISVTTKDRKEGQRRGF